MFDNARHNIYNISIKHKTNRGVKMKKVVVYSKPSCPQCDATKRRLKKHGIEFETVDLTQDAESLAKVKSMGHSSAPVVIVNDGEQHWNGYDMEKIDSLK